MKAKKACIFILITLISSFAFFLANCSAPTPSGTDNPPVNTKPPVHAAQGISFADTDNDTGFVAGDVLIVKAADEADITHYVLYWGTDTTTKLTNTANKIAELPKTGADVSYSLNRTGYQFVTTGGVSEKATHILVFTKNNNGEMATGIAVEINDLTGPPPQHTAVGITFTDINLLKGQIQGDIIVQRATEESDITAYALYWGTSATTKWTTEPLSIINKTETDIKYTVKANTILDIAITYILAFTRNTNGEMSTCVATKLDDAVAPPPQHSAQSITFTDLDPGCLEAQGDVIIGKASDESDITHYVLYWGSSDTAKLSKIREFAKTGNDLKHTFYADTVIPAAATHLLVFTKNESQEMATGISIAINEVPVRQLIDNTGKAAGIYSLVPADIDHNGSMDFFSASTTSSNGVAWWKNDGTGAFSCQVIAGSTNGYQSVFAVDMDGDSDMDAVAVSNTGREVAWLQNNEDGTFIKFIIASDFVNAYSILSTDLDKDGDQDVIAGAYSASGSGNVDIAWWENDGEEHFTKHSIAGGNESAKSLFVADMDNDGDCDILSGGKNGGYWWKNDGSYNFEKINLGLGIYEVSAINAGDLDNDGDIDIVCGLAGATYNLCRLRNNGSNQYTKLDFTTTRFDIVNAVYLADLDNNGYIDILVSGSGGSTNVGSLVWIKNNGSSSFTNINLEKKALIIGTCCVFDVDGDGKLDVIGSNTAPGELLWWKLSQ